MPIPNFNQLKQLTKQGTDDEPVRQAEAAKKVSRSNEKDKKVKKNRQNRLFQVAERQIRAAAGLGNIITTVQVPGDAGHPDTDALIQSLDQKNLVNSLTSRDVNDRRVCMHDPITGAKRLIFAPKPRTIWEVTIEWESA